MEQHLVAVGDSAALGRRLADLVDWPDLDPGLGARCRDWVEEHFPYERHVDQLEQVLNSAVRDRRARLVDARQ